MNSVKKIRIFGDSILKGTLLDPLKERYHTIKHHGITYLEQRFHLEITSRASFGCTVTKGSQLMERSKERGYDADVVLLEFGGNDCDFNWAEVSEHPDAEHQPNTPIDVFEQKFIAMIRELRRQHVHPLMMTIPPIDADRYLDWICHYGPDRSRILRFLGGDVQAIARFQELYALSLFRIASQTHTQIVDIRSSFLMRKDFPSLLCKDGIHPTEKGHQLITSVFAEYASRMLPAL